jgi:hypothetical protein
MAIGRSLLDRPMSLYFVAVNGGARRTGSRTKPATSTDRSQILEDLQQPIKVAVHGGDAGVVVAEGCLGDL